MAMCICVCLWQYIYATKGLCLTLQQCHNYGTEIDAQLSCILEAGRMQAVRSASIPPIST